MLGMDRDRTGTRLGLVALILAVGVIAVQPLLATPPENEPRPEQYTRSCSSYKLYGHSATVADTLYNVEDGNGVPVLFGWGEQLEITCRGVAAGYAIGLVHQDPSTFPSVDLGGATECGTGCGDVDDSAGPSGIHDHGPAFIIQDGTTKYRRISRGIFSRQEKAPTSRGGRCTTVGAGYRLNGPCDVAAECGTAGVCTKDSTGPSGAFLGISVSNTNLTCQIESCI